METRFGIKDLFLFGLLLAVAGLVLLAMVQYDHQYLVLLKLEQGQEAQATDLAALRRQVQQGAVTAAPTVPTTNPAAVAGPSGRDPFARQRAAEALPGYARGDWFVDSGPNTDKVTPVLDGDAFGAEVQARVLETLLTRDPVTLAWQPLLAQPGWTVEDHAAEYAKWRAGRLAAGATEEQIAKDRSGPVAIRVRFRVRAGATFSDGRPVTADDVAWTFGWIMNPAVEAARQRAYLGKVRRVVRDGPDGVTFELNEPYFDFLGLVGGMAVLPAHYYQQFAPEAFNRAPCLLMGSGPYCLADPAGWKPGEDVVLVRNDHYWGEPPAFDRVVYRIIIKDLPRVTAFTNGELDYLSASPDQYQSLLANPAVVARTQHREFDPVSGGYRFIGWNERRGGKATPFADRRVRQAMTLLTDRQRVCDDLMKGLATPAGGPFNRLGKQADPAVADWAYDPDRAGALLAAAGFTADGSGQLRGPDGRPFAFRLTYPQGSTTSDRLMLFLKESYARAGVTMTPDPLDWSVFSQRIKERDFDAISMGWTSGIENDVFQMFDSKQVDNGGENFVAYRNPDLDALMERARATVDEAARLPLWHRCHAVLHDDQPYTFLFTRKSTVFIDGRVRNVQLVPLGLNDLTEWFAPAGAQKWER